MYRNVLCYGDSNTYGFDPRSPLGDRYPAAVRWTGLLNTRPGWRIVNGGLNGRRVPFGPWELASAERLVAGSAPLAALAVLLGSNDLLQGRAPRTAAERMDAFLRRALAAPALRGGKVLLVAPVPLPFSPELMDRSAQLAEDYAAVARELGVAFADPAGWDIDLTFDGIHYSPQGHRRFAAEMELVLTELLAS